MKYRTNTYVVLKTKQYLPAHLKKKAGRIFRIEGFDGVKIKLQQLGFGPHTVCEEKHISHVATKEELKVKVVDLKMAKRPTSKALRGMPTPVYKAGDVVYVTRGGCIVRILSVKEDNKYEASTGFGGPVKVCGGDIKRLASLKEIEWFNKTYPPRYKKGDKVTVTYSEFPEVHHLGQVIRIDAGTGRYHVKCGADVLKCYEAHLAPLAPEPRYKKGDVALYLGHTQVTIRDFNETLEEYCILFEKSGVRTMVKPEDLEPAKPRYKRGDHIKCRDMGWIREHCTFDRKTKFWVYQDDKLSEIIVQHVAGKAFEILSVTDPVYYGISNDYYLPEWLISECVYSAPESSQTAQPKFKKGDKVVLHTHDWIKKNTTLSESGHYCYGDSEQYFYGPNAKLEGGKTFTVDGENKYGVYLREGVLAPVWAIDSVVANDAAPEFKKGDKVLHLGVYPCTFDRCAGDSARVLLFDSEHHPMWVPMSELTPEPKFKIGDEVTITFHEKPKVARSGGIITKIELGVYTVKCEEDSFRCTEQQLSSCSLIGGASLTSRIEALERELKALKRKVG